MEQLRETAQVGHDSRLSPSRADLRVSQKYSGQGTPYFEDFQRELHAIFLTEGIEDKWDRIENPVTQLNRGGVDERYDDG